MQFEIYQPFQIEGVLLNLKEHVHIIDIMSKVGEEESLQMRLLLDFCKVRVSGDSVQVVLSILKEPKYITPSLPICIHWLLK